MNMCFGRVSAPNARATLSAMALLSQMTAVLDRFTVKPLLCNSWMIAAPIATARSVMGPRLSNTVQPMSST